MHQGHNLESSLVVNCGTCILFKESGWSTNETSDLPLTLTYDIFGHKPIFSKEKIQILQL